MKRIQILLLAVCLALFGCACGAADPQPEPEAQPTASAAREEPSSAPERLEDGAPSARPELQSEEAPTEKPEEKESETIMKMQVKIGEKTFTATLEQNAAVRELTEMMREAPVTIEMHDYSGFEKVGPLGRSLPTENSRTVTEAGDIVLYNGDQIVMFYGSNTWSYTRLGRIDDLTGWEEALGSGDITAVFSLAGE